jgi:hypothetical protein
VALLVLAMLDMTAWQEIFTISVISGLHCLQPWLLGFRLLSP